MQSGSTPISSYGELARRCLQAEEWPTEMQPKARSLAALFSKFDRSIELEWLADRPAVQRVLARVLECPLALVETSLGGTLGTVDERQMRWRFQDVPIATPLNLLQEELPPGYHSLLRTPQRWQRLWWRAAPGDGIDLLRAWLGARRLAKTITVHDAQELAVHCQSSEPLLAQWAAPQSAADALSAFDLPPICVVCRDPAPQGWTGIDPTPAEQYLQPLLAWLSERLPSDGHFEPDVALSWFRDNLDENTADLETVLGLAGLLDELGVEKVRGRPLHRLAEDYTQRRLSEAGLAGNGDAQWLKPVGFEVLLGMAKGTLTESSLPWDEARSQEEWTALVPPEFQRGVDVEWASISLSRSAKLSSSELKEALSELPPGSFRVVRALSAAHLLAADSRGLWHVNPRWLSSALQRRAQRALLRDSPFEWGEALLSASNESSIRAAVLEQTADPNTDLLERLLELESSADEPALVIAVETLVLGLGRACLAGIEFDPEQLEALLEMQLDALVELPGPILCPRLLTDAQSPSVRGGWLLSLWAIAEQSELQRRAVPQTANPWTGVTDTEALRRCLDDILECFEDSEWGDWVAGGYALVARLCDKLQFERAWSHPVLLPTSISPASSFADWQALERAPHGLRSARELAPDWDSLARSAWLSWVRAGSPSNSLLSPNSEHARLFWPHLPPEVLSSILVAGGQSNLPTPLLSEKCWLALLLHAYPPSGDTGSRFPLPANAAGAIPKKLQRQALRGACAYGDLGTLEVLWEAQTELAMEETLNALQQLQQGVSSAKPIALHLLKSAPVGTHAPLLTAVGSAVSKIGVGSPLDDVARPWLHQLVNQRVPQWRDSYAILAEFERRLRRARIARLGN